MLSKKFIFIISALVLLPIGCSKNSGGENGSDTNNSSTDPSNGTDPNSNDTFSDSNSTLNNNNNTDNGEIDTENMDICADLTNNLSKIETRAMILLDRSGSMTDANKWEQSLEAIEFMVENHESDLAFGLDLFSVSYDRNDRCAIAESAALDVALNNASEIIDLLDEHSPSQATPLYLSIANYLDPDFAPVFLNNEGNSYLIVISDGADTCGVDGVFSWDGVTNEELRDVTSRLLEERGIKTIVIGFGDEAEPDQLNAIASVGGSMFTEYIDAANGDALTSALVNIAENVVTNCEFVVGEFDEEENVNINFVNVYFDDKIIPRDDNCEAQTGWTWLDDEKTIIGFCQESCAELEAGFIEEINVKVACSEDDVVIIVIK